MNLLTFAAASVWLLPDATLYSADPARVGADVGGLHRREYPSVPSAANGGITPPTPIALLFLIDTGASHSSVDQAAIAPLGLSPTGTVSVLTPTTGAVPVEQPSYDVSIYIHHTENAKFLALLPVTATDFSAQPIHGLLGRDFLQSCLLVYDGLAQTYSIAF